MSRRLPLSASNPRQPGRMARDRRLWAHDLSSTSALFVAPRTPIFPGFSRMVARLFANPRGPVGFQELKNTSFFQAFLVTRDYNMGKSRAKLVFCPFCSTQNPYFSRVFANGSPTFCKP